MLYRYNKKGYNTRCHLSPAHWHICAPYIPTRKDRGIHQSLTILRFESIQKIGESRRGASILPPTGSYDESKDLSSLRSLVFAHNIFIEPLDNCQHAKTTIASTKRPTQNLPPPPGKYRSVWSLRLFDPSVCAIRHCPRRLVLFLLFWPCLFRPKSVSTRQSPPTRGRS